MNDSATLKLQLDRIRTRALLVGVVALALSAVWAFKDQQQFFQSYLLGYMFWIGISLGSFAIVALHHLTTGGWGFAIQRLLEAASRTLPLMALLVLPFLFGMQELFLWARPEAVANDAVLQHKAPYLNATFFWVRIVVYFAIWSAFTYFLNKWSKLQDDTSEGGFINRIEKISGPALVFYVLTVSFAAFDFVMSLEPHWFSTIFGVMFVIGQVLLTMAFAIVVVAQLRHQQPLAEVMQTKHFHDLGNLMMAFILLWAYMSFSQFFIIWSGNLPEEIPWYLHRLDGGWQVVALLIVVFHFAVPFMVLLSRKSKRRAHILWRVALAMIFMRWVDLFWIIAPNFHEHGFAIHWLDVVLPVGIGGLWIAYFLWQLQGRPLLPVNDPRLREAFAHE